MILFGLSIIRYRSWVIYVFIATFININPVDPLTHLPLDKNGCHYADDIFEYIFLKEYVWILIMIPPNFVPKGPINLFHNFSPSG